MQCSLQTGHSCGHSTTRRHKTWPCDHAQVLVSITHHWLRWLGEAWMVLLWGSRGGRGVGRLRLCGRWAAVGHGQLTQVRGVCGENRRSLGTVQTSFSWVGDKQKKRLSFCPVSLYSSKFNVKVMNFPAGLRSCSSHMGKGLWDHNSWKEDVIVPGFLVYNRMT